jgi:polyphosphate glucokinase
MTLLGIDIGGTGMKGALVDTVTGALLSERFRLDTPKKRDPEGMAQCFQEIVEHFNYSGPIGAGFPTIIKNGVCGSQGNLHKSWKGLDVAKVFSEKTGLQVTVVNDADAAGYATMRYGVGKGEPGLVLMITIGTGIGSGAFFNGQLIPNVELGQIPYKKYKRIEEWVSASAKERDGLTLEEWATRFNKFLKITDLLVAPDLIILGGGLSKEWDSYAHLIDSPIRIKPAALRNNAGIVGAAAAAITGL